MCIGKSATKLKRFAPESIAFTGVAVTKFQGDIGEYELLMTEDGSPSLYNFRFLEACHSSAGARSETLYNYIHGTHLPERLKDHSPFVVFEVGFGTGLGHLTTSEIAGNSPLLFISTELDEGLIRWLRGHKPYKSLAPVSYGNLLTYQMKSGTAELIILVGDATRTLPEALDLNLIPPVHSIYQDPFSPKKNPTLWSVEWFKLLKSIAHQDVELGTYSSSSGVQRALCEAGWELTLVKGFAHKKQSLRARLKK